MHQPLIILSPPRSFSSVVSTIIGEHPQLYGFPELHLFGAETVEELIRKEQKGGNVAGPPGVLRTLAQEHDQVQTSATITKGIAWLHERKHWSTKKLLDYLFDLVNPKIAVEKSPGTASKTKHIERAYAMYPQAYYLHLTRHPLSARNSIHEFFTTKKRSREGVNSYLKSSVDSLLVWFLVHTNIVNFTNSLPVGQTMRIKGEDLLSQPDIYLPQIAQWLGLRTDAEAIEAMKHPENSPYACIGPFPACGGNDPKFMRSPKLRQGRVKEPSLQTFWETENWEWITAQVKKWLTENAFEVGSKQEIMAEITRLANSMGYQ